MLIEGRDWTEEELTILVRGALAERTYQKSIHEETALEKMMKEGPPEQAVSAARKLRAEFGDEARSKRFAAYCVGTRESRALMEEVLP